MEVEEREKKIRKRKKRRTGKLPHRLVASWTTSTAPPLPLLYCCLHCRPRRSSPHLPNSPALARPSPRRRGTPRERRKT